MIVVAVGVTVEKAVAMAGVVVALMARAPRLMPVAMIMAGMVVIMAVARVGVFIGCHWWPEYKSSPVKAPKRRFAGRLQRSRRWRDGALLPGGGRGRVQIGLQADYGGHTARGLQSFAREVPMNGGRVITQRAVELL